MPDDEYKMPKMTLGQFENALLNWLDALEANKESDEPIWRRILGGWNPAMTTIAEYTDELYNYYMDLAEAQGVGAWLPNYGEILKIGAPGRYEYEMATQYQEKLTDWQAEVKEALAEDWDRRFAERKFQADEAYRKWQQETTERREQRDWAMEASRIATEQQRYKWETQQERTRFQQLASDQWYNQMMTGREEPSMSQRERAKLFEDVRSEMLYSIGEDPQDWLRRAEIQNMPNRWAPATTTDTSAERTAQLQKEEKYYTDALKDAYARLTGKGPLKENDPLYQAPQMQAHIKAMYEALQSTENQLQQAQEQHINWSQKAQNVGLGPWTTQPGQSAWGAPANPLALQWERQAEENRLATPNWLKPFVPGLGEWMPGIGSVKGDIPQGTVPHWSAYESLLPSQQAQLAGYWTYAGQNPEDILAQMTRNRATEAGEQAKAVIPAWKTTPKSLRLGRTWQVAKQYA